MPRSLRLLLALLLAALSLASISPSGDVEAHTGYYRVNGGDGLRLREGPGGEYRIITVMPHNSRLKAFGHKGNWLKVRYLATGAIGWTWLAYVVPDGGNATAPSSGLPRCFWNYWSRTVCAPEWIAAAVADAARAYGVSYWNLMAVAACESDFNPYAYNGATGVSGLFQFLPSTFYAFGGSSLWSVYDQAYVAARMFARGLAYHWHCARLLGIA
jgi:hypothetical protein